MTRIKLDTSLAWQERRAVQYFPDTAKAWSTSDQSLDSVLYEMPLQESYYYLSRLRRRRSKPEVFRSLINSYAIDSNQLRCPDLPVALYVLVKHKMDSISVEVLKQYNPFLESEIHLSYFGDSIKKWTPDNFPEGAFPRLTIRFPYCIANNVVVAPWELYLLPLKSPSLTYSDKRMNELPLTIVQGRSRVARVANASISFYKKEYALSDDKSLEVGIKENGKFQRDRIVNNLRYKERYRIFDTLIIGEKAYRLDSVDKSWEYAYLHTVKSSSQWLARNYLKQLLPYFSPSKDYLVVDFWGTWCGPCIKKMPELRALHDSVESRYNFLSICFDNPKNYQKARELFSENKLEWPQFFNDQASDTTLTFALRVSSFPTYMIVRRDGLLFYSGNGANGFDELKGLVSRKP